MNLKPIAYSSLLLAAVCLWSAAAFAGAQFASSIPGESSVLAAERMTIYGKPAKSPGYGVAVFYLHTYIVLALTIAAIGVLGSVCFSIAVKRLRHNALLLTISATFCVGVLVIEATVTDIAPTRGDIVVRTIARNDYDQVASFLTVKGYSEYYRVSVSDGRITLPHLAAILGSRESMRAICDLGFDINVPHETYGFTPLHIAAGASFRRRDIAMYNLLVARGADIDIRDCAGKRPSDYLRSTNEE